MNPTAPVGRPDRVRPASPDALEEPIVVVFDAELARCLRESTRPSPAEPPRQERPAPRREAFQYD
jgi:hypothetical protein